MIRRFVVMAGIWLPTNDPYVLVVVADPEPNEVVAVFKCHRPMGSADPRGPEASDIPESQGRMSGVRLQQLEVPVGSPLHCGRQFLESPPEVRVCSVQL